jgi:hypothetical protein
MNHHGSKEKFNCLIGKWENIVKRKGTKTFTCGKDSSPAIMNGGITGTIKKTQGPQTLSTGILAKHFG